MDETKRRFSSKRTVSSPMCLLVTFLNCRSTSAYEDLIYNTGYGPAAAKRGVELAPLNVVKYNGSIMLGNSHVSLGQPVRLPQNYKPILGYHIPEKVKPLPEVCSADAFYYELLWRNQFDIMYSQSQG